MCNKLSAALNIAVQTACSASSLLAADAWYVLICKQAPKKADWRGGLEWAAAARVLRRGGQGTQLSFALVVLCTLSPIDEHYAHASGTLPRLGHRQKGACSPSPGSQSACPALQEQLQRPGQRRRQQQRQRARGRPRRRRCGAGPCAPAAGRGGPRACSPGSTAGFAGRAAGGSV